MTETTQIPKEKLNLFVLTGKHYLNSTKEEVKVMGSRRCYSAQGDQAAHQS
jgi:hypothetical protein